MSRTDRAQQGKAVIMKGFSIISAVCLIILASSWPSANYPWKSQGGTSGLYTILPPLSWRDIGREWARGAVPDPPAYQFPIAEPAREGRLGAAHHNVQRDLIHSHAWISRHIDGPTDVGCAVVYQKQDAVWLGRLARHRVPSTPKHMGIRPHDRHLPFPARAGSGTLVQGGEPVPDLEVFVRAGCPIAKPRRSFSMYFGVSGHRFGSPSTTLLRTQPLGSGSRHWLVSGDSITLASPPFSSAQN